MKGSIISLIFGFVIMVLVLLITTVVLQDQRPKASLYSETNFEESKYKSVAVTGVFLQDDKMRRKIGMHGLNGNDYEEDIKNVFQNELASGTLDIQQKVLSVDGRDISIEFSQGNPEGYTQVYVASPSENLRLVTVGAQ